MVMVGQHERLRQPLRWTKAGRATVAAIAGIAAAAAIALVVALASGSGSSKLPAGCISVTFPSTVGGATVHACGSKARADCASPGSSSLGTPVDVLREACERAKLPFETS